MLNHQRQFTRGYEAVFAGFCVRAFLHARLFDYNLQTEHAMRCMNASCTTCDLNLYCLLCL